MFCIQCEQTIQTPIAKGCAYTGFSEEKPVAAPVSQQSVFLDSLRASSSSKPKYRIVLSSFDCPSKIYTVLMFFAMAKKRPNVSTFSPFCLPSEAGKPVRLKET